MPIHGSIINIKKLKLYGFSIVKIVTNNNKSPDCFNYYACINIILYFIVYHKIIYTQYNKNITCIQTKLGTTQVLKND